jgi:hypothetical protein
VSCSMKNPFFGQEQVETISIPGQYCSFWGQDGVRRGYLGSGMEMPCLVCIFDKVLGPGVRALLS